MLRQAVISLLLVSCSMFSACTTIRTLQAISPEDIDSGDRRDIVALMSDSSTYRFAAAQYQIFEDSITGSGFSIQPNGRETAFRGNLAVSDIDSLYGSGETTELSTGGKIGVAVLAGAVATIGILWAAEAIGSALRHGGEFPPRVLEH